MDSRTEIEAKFSVSDLDEIRQRLVNQAGRVFIPQHQERNLYFDTPDRRLKSGKQILRIRTGTDIRMTHKHQAESFEARTEIELVLDDASAAQAMLRALGFELILSYSKMREIFEFEDVHVMLDELPFGHFVEIEGPSLERVQKASTRLGFDWKKRLNVGYLALFEQARERLDLPVHEISFDAISRDHPLRSLDLGLVDGSPTQNPGRITP